MLPKDTIRVLDSDGLAAQVTTPVQWLWANYLAAGMVTLVIGHAKCGKTTLLSLLLERLQSGQPLAGAPVLAKRAFVISEESAELWQLRAQALSLNCNVQWVCWPFLERLRPEDYMNVLRASRDSGADLVVIDSLSHFLPECRENHAESLLQALEPLHQLTGRGVAVLVMHHPRKDRTPGEMTARGCGALTSFADIVVHFHTLRKAGITDRRRVIRCTSRLCESTERILELTPDGRDYVPATETPIDGADLAGWEVLKMVLEDAAAEQTQKQILAAWPEDYVAPSKATLHRWLRQACQDGRLVCHGGGRSGDPFRYSLEIAVVGSPDPTTLMTEGLLRLAAKGDLRS